MRTLYIAAALIFAATAAHAETARELRNRCTGMTGLANVSMCRTTVGSAVNTFRDDPTYCIPKDLEGSQALATVKTYLLAHPGDFTQPANDEIGKAMAEAYPCSAKP